MMYLITVLNHNFYLAIFNFILFLLPLNYGENKSLETSNIPFNSIGKLQPKSANEIGNSLLSIGAETMDRDYTIYKNWRDFLGPLGFKKARIQSGWAKTELEPGIYDWSWLDFIVFDMLEQGVKPWMNLTWGNPLYTEPYGDRGGPPKSDKQLEAWGNFIHALVSRYSDYIDEWEIWNESKKLTPDEEAKLIMITSEIIKGIQPSSKIIIFALDHTSFQALLDTHYCTTIKSKNQKYNCNYAKEVLDILVSNDKLFLIDEVSYHPYSYNPDDVNHLIDSLKQFIHSYDKRLKIRQGENGAPSERNDQRALAAYQWTETSQAKWALRRMVSDLSHNMITSYFSISDMKYLDEINRKGLLYINDDKTIRHAKKGYYSLQNLASVFTEQIVSVPLNDYKASDSIPLSVSTFRDTKNDQFIAAVWKNDEIPKDTNSYQTIEVTFPKLSFSNPVYVDLLSGLVYEIPDNFYKKSNSGMTFTLPIYDSPILILEINQIGLL